MGDGNYFDRAIPKSSRSTRKPNDHVTRVVEGIDVGIGSAWSNGQAGKLS
jgi:hypothetical protein